MSQAIVIGAGPGGLAVAGALLDQGLAPLIVEAGDVAASWRARYDRVHLNTSTWFSHLPGRRFPREVGRFPSREELIGYYEGFVAERGIEIRRHTRVRRIEHGEPGWVLHTDDGALRGERVIVATGKDHTPIFPPWPGRDTFTGELLHASDYRNAEPHSGRDVLVVGAGNSGSEIAVDLAEGGARRVRLSVRTPPSLTHRSVAGIPNDVFAVAVRRVPVPIVDRLGWWMQRVGFGDLSAYGLSRPPEGVYTRLRRRGTIPTIDGGSFIATVKQGQIVIVAGVDRFEGRRVELADGMHLEPDVVIAATGYDRDLDGLVGHLGVLDQGGRPQVSGSHYHESAPGLYFIGFTDPLSGNIREMRLDAKKIARSIAHETEAVAEAPA